MTRQIIIEGGLVSIVDSQVTQTVPLEDYLPLIERRNPILAPVLPAGTRAFWWDPTDLAAQKLVIMIEREPHIAHIGFQGHAAHAVQLPYSRFIFTAKTPRPEDNLSWQLDDYRTFWSNHRYSNPDQADMIAPMLPNVYRDGRICFGSTAADANASIADRLDATVNGFFTSTFNHDLGVPFPNGWSSWAAWERMTRNDPTAWTQWTNWNPGTTKSSLTQLLANLRNNIANRTDIVVTPDPIPPLELGATFGRFTEWLDTLSNHDRAIAWAAMSQAQAANPALFTADGDPTTPPSTGE